MSVVPQPNYEILFRAYCKDIAYRRIRQIKDVTGLRKYYAIGEYNDEKYINLSKLDINKALEILYNHEKIIWGLHKNIKKIDIQNKNFMSLIAEKE